MSAQNENLLSVVVPVYNEEASIAAFFVRLQAVLECLPLRHEIIFVDDGSDDGTSAILQQLSAEHAHVGIVELSRNFGQEIALTAGIDHSKGDAVVVIDADLQDPPEIIPQLIERWREGYDVVYGQRISRAGESWLKRTTSNLFYRLLGRLGALKVPPNTGIFRLLSRRAIDGLAQLREQHRFMRGLFTWIGYRQTAVPYERDPRIAGTSKWDYWRLWNLSIEGITSVSLGPLKIATYFGVLTAFFAFVFGAWIIFKTLIYGEPVAGYPTIMVTVLFMGGVQLIAIGVIGEYLGRVFDETKGRPLYLVQAQTQAEPKLASGEEAPATDRVAE